MFISTGISLLGAQAGGVLWTPADITTQIWYDASDVSTITETGGRLSIWGDKSGNSRNASGGNGADYNLAQINGLNVLQFSNTSADWLNTDLNWMASAKYSITAMCTRNNSGANYMTGRQSGATNGLFHIGWDNNITFRMAHFSSPAQVDLSVPSYTTEVPIMYTGYNRTTVGKGIRYFAPTGYLTATNANTTDLASETFATLGNFGNGIWWGGKMCEIVMTNNSVADSVLEQIEGYMAWKWGQESSLPVTHPYYSAPPYV